MTPTAAVPTTGKTRKQHIANVEKWIGRYVRHTDNWWDFAWNQNGYVVCERTGKLIPVADEAYYGDYFDSKQIAEAAGYDECYYYSSEGLAIMHRQYQKAVQS